MLRRNDEFLKERFGHDVRQARIELGLKALELYRALDIDMPSNSVASVRISALELEGCTPAGCLFFPLCEALGIDPMGYKWENAGFAILCKLYKKIPLTTEERVKGMTVFRQHLRYAKKEYWLTAIVEKELERAEEE